MCNRVFINRREPLHSLTPRSLLATAHILVASGSFSPVFVRLYMREESRPPPWRASVVVMTLCGWCLLLAKPVGASMDPTRELPVSRIIDADFYFPATHHTVPLSLDPWRQSVEGLIDGLCETHPCPAGNNTKTDLVEAFRRHVQSSGRQVYENDTAAMEAWPWLRELGQGVGEGIDPESWLAHAEKITREQTWQRAQEIHGLLAGELRIFNPDCLGPSSLQMTVGACPLHAAIRVLNGDEVKLHLKASGSSATPVVLELVGADAQTWSAVGSELAAEEQLEHARAAYTRALALLPVDAPAMARLEIEGYLVVALQEQGSLPSASSLLNAMLVDPALSSQPEARTAYRFKAATLLPPILPAQVDLSSLRASLAADLDSFLLFTPPEDDGTIQPMLSNPLRQVGKTLFHLAHQGRNDVDLQVSLTRLLADLSPSLTWSSPYLNETITAAKHDSSIVSVGVVSHHLYDHSIGRMLANLLRNLAERSTLNLTLFTTATPGPDDQVYMYLREAMGVAFVHLPYDLEAARTTIAEHRLDVVLYSDLGMEPFTYFLSFSRLAPVQAVWWGHPVTTGLPSMDYFISLIDEDQEEAQGQYTEQVIRMQWVNTPAIRLTPQSPNIPLTELGLPSNDARVYMVLGRLFKLHPDFDATLIEILRRDPKAVLVLVHEKKRESWTRATWLRLTASQPGWIRSRVRVVHHWNYVEALQHAVAVLDTYPYGGCLTTLDAFAHAVPVVTLPSHLLRGRFTLALYRQMGVLDCIASTMDQYIHIALRLGSDQAFRNYIIGQIIERHDRLGGSTEETAQEWEAMLRRIAGVKGDERDT